MVGNSIIGISAIEPPNPRDTLTASGWLYWMVEDLWQWMDLITVHNPAAITASASLPQPGSTPLTSRVADSSAARVKRSTHSGGAERGS